MIVSELPGPKVSKILTDAGVDPSSYSAPIVEEGKGIYVRDPDGNVFVDLISGRAIVNTGYCHPRIVAAIRDQAGRTIHSLTEGSYSLSKRLESMLDSGPKQVYWSQSGSMANEHAIKAVRRSTGRPIVIGFIGSYHGTSIGALSISGYDPSMKRHYGPLLPGVAHVPYASCYRCPMNQDYPGCDLACIAYIEEVAFTSYIPSDEVAAIFVEPVQGDAGWHVPPPGWHQELKRLCERHGILLVADEVQTGFGRAGRWLGMDNWGVKPDVVTLSKAMGSGVPIAACVLGKDLVPRTSSEAIPIDAQSFAPTPMGIAAVHATMDVIKDERLCENAVIVGDHIRARLREMMDSYPLIGDVRGIGMITGVEIVKDGRKKTPDPEAAKAICAEMFRRGIYTVAMGAHGGKAIRVEPPLVMTVEEADTSLEIFEESIKTVIYG